MGNIRLLLWATLAALIYMNYQAWMHDYPTVPLVSSSMEAGGARPASLGDTVPQGASGTTPAAGTLATAPPASTPGAASLGAAVPGVTTPGTSDVTTLAPVAGVPAADPTGAAMLHVVTDVLDISINLKGGEVDRADLLEYPLRKDTPNTPVRLMSREPPAALYLMQSGLAGSAGEAAPTHLATWQSAAQSYTLAPGADELRVPLTWSEQGLNVTKTFVFKRGQYAIELDYDVKNEGSADRKLASYTQIQRHWEHASRS